MNIKLLAFIIYATTCGLVAIGQEQPKTILYQQTLLRSDKPDTCNYVYIEQDKDGECYKRLETTTYIDATIKDWKEQNDYKEKTLRRLPVGFPKNWCYAETVHDGKLYLYAPSDWYNHASIAFRNNMILQGPESDGILDTGISVTKISQRQYAVRSRKEHFNIHIIDTAANIAVFEYSGDNNQRSYHLMIDMRKVRTLPVIVNHSPCGKVTEHRPKNDYYIDYRQTLTQRRVIIKRKA